MLLAVKYPAPALNGRGSAVAVIPDVLFNWNCRVAVIVNRVETAIYAETAIHATAVRRASAVRNQIASAAPALVLVLVQNPVAVKTSLAVAGLARVAPADSLHAQIALVSDGHVLVLNVQRYT